MSFFELLVSAGNYYTLVILISFSICLWLKDFQGAVFSGVTAAFFLIGISYYPYLIEWDTEKVFRYPIWFFHELTWMGVIAYLGLKDRISMKYCILGQLFGVPLITINVFRAMDVHYIDLAISGLPYGIIYTLCEVSIVCLCCFPAILGLKNKFFSNLRLAQ